MRNPKMNKKKKKKMKMSGKIGGLGRRVRSGSSAAANNNRMGGTSFTPTPGLPVKIDKRLTSENNGRSTPKHLLGKNDICRNGTRIVKGASHRLSKVLRTRYKDLIAIKTDLEARPINQDTKFLLDSIENTIRIVKGFRKQVEDLSFDHTRNKFIGSLKSIQMTLSYVAKSRDQKDPEPGVSRPDFQRIPCVRKVQSCSTLCELNQPPFMVDSHVVFSNALLPRENDSYTYYPSDYEKGIYIEIFNSTQASEETLSIKVEHPIVSIIGNYAINAFNGAFEQHVRNGEHNRLRQFEFLECKFLKFACGHHFEMTIEAFEEVYIGTYRTEVIWNIDFSAITVCTFVLTNIKPFGTKALAVHYLSRIRRIKISVINLCKKKVHRLERLRRRTHGPERGTARVEIKRLRSLRDETIEGLKLRQYEDIKLLFPSDCHRPTKRDGCSHPVASSGMVRRKKDTTTYGYDLYNPTVYMRSAHSDGCSHPVASSGMVRRKKDTTTYGYDLYNPTVYMRSAHSDGCSHPVASSGMVRRKKDTTTYGYDLYNPTVYMRSAHSGPRKQSLNVLRQELIRLSGLQKKKACNGAHTGKETKCL